MILCYAKCSACPRKVSYLHFLLPIPWKKNATIRCQAYYINSLIECYSPSPVAALSIAVIVFDDTFLILIIIPVKKDGTPILDYIAQRPNIMEVILSGGDPLMATDDHLQDFLSALSTIGHIQLLRFHTRLPVVAPSRITSELIALLEKTPFTTSMVYHINHRP